MRLNTALIAASLAVIAGSWTAAGETFDPVLSNRDLPLDVLAGCTVAGNPEICVEEQGFRSRWVGRSAQGNLFVVTSNLCRSGDCRAWLVEKTAVGARTLLALNGEFRLDRGHGPYPLIQLRTRLNEHESHLSRYEWQGGQYARTDSQLRYRVDGAECGTREECRELAGEAMRRQQVDRAVKIWERVHGVSWI